MTCAELYQCNPTFRAGIDTWVADKRCPLEMADFLRELGMDAPAECAEWAATAPDMRPYSPIVSVEGDEPRGPYPTYTSGVPGWFWTEGISEWASWLPPGQGKCCPDDPHRRGYATCHPTVAEAILFLLDHWVVYPLRPPRSM